MIDPDLIAAFSDIGITQDSYNTQQRTVEWFEARAGKITGSRFNDILPGKRGGYLKSRERVISQMVIETLSGKPMMTDSFKQTEWGSQCEEVAVEAFQKKTGLTVEETGFIDHPEVDRVGCSVDGLIKGAQSIIEIKCPYDPINHLEYALGLPDIYKAQVQGNMWVTGMNLCYFVSFDPRMPEPYDLVIHTIKRDSEYIDNLYQECIKTISDYNLKLKTVKEKFECLNS